MINSYVAAIQSPDSFVSPRHRRAKFELDPRWGIPRLRSGSTAAVLQAVIEGAPKALRFYIREPESSRARYQALDAFVEAKGLRRHVIRAQWWDDAIRVDGRLWPMVEMDWVDGRALDRHVAELIERSDQVGLLALADAWRRLIRRLQSEGFAHGSLQHGNVLVDDTSTLRLVSLDNVWTEGMPHRPSRAVGHRNYADPNLAWGRWMDTFPALVIDLSLRALALQPALWNEFHNGENLLFQLEDFRASRQTALWTRIAALRDPQLDALADALSKLCPPSRPSHVSLDMLLPGDSAANHVFVSYAREDNDRVKELADQLECRGVAVWVDTTGTVGGRDWTEQVTVAIRDASAVVLVISAHSMASRAVQREVLYAEDEGRPVIPVVVENVALPDWYRFHFRLLHRIDGTHPERAAAAVVAAVSR
jgi:hypothetical protein